MCLKIFGGPNNKTASRDLALKKVSFLALLMLFDHNIELTGSSAMDLTLRNQATDYPSFVSENRIVQFPILGILA